jgi:hypothetical protein
MVAFALPFGTLVVFSFHPRPMVHNGGYANPSIINDPGAIWSGQPDEARSDRFHMRPRVFSGNLFPEQVGRCEVYTDFATLCREGPRAHLNLHNPDLTSGDHWKQIPVP